MAPVWQCDKSGLVMSSSIRETLSIFDGQARLGVPIAPWRADIRKRKRAHRHGAACYTAGMSINADEREALRMLAGSPGGRRSPKARARGMKKTRPARNGPGSVLTDTQARLRTQHMANHAMHESSQRNVSTSITALHPRQQLRDLHRLPLTGTGHGRGKDVLCWPV
jgi:hypothetical protein